MPKRPLKTEPTLYELYLRYVARCKKKRIYVPTPDDIREAERNFQKLVKRGIVTSDDLVRELKTLPPALRLFGIYKISTLKIRAGIPALFELMKVRTLRTTCAHELHGLDTRGTLKTFLEIGRRELNSRKPDPSWLEAVVHGINWTTDLRCIDLLVSIVERKDLPGWVRDLAADKVGGSCDVLDRRMTLYRRCCEVALSGLHDDSINVQFGCMYLLGQLASNTKRKRDRKRFESALPRLREISKNDHRLSPGYWWPMSAEAKDVIHCIRHGRPARRTADERYQNRACGLFKQS